MTQLTVFGLHSDKHNNKEEYKEKFQLITQANDVLGNSELRKQFDNGEDPNVRTSLDPLRAF